MSQVERVLDEQVRRSIERYVQQELSKIGIDMMPDSSIDADSIRSSRDICFDGDATVEQGPAEERIYRQPIYLRQFQAPTPEPINIEIQEVLVDSSTRRSPIEVTVRRRSLKTPSPIFIRSEPPITRPAEDNRVYVYEKLVPSKEKEKRQMIIHEYPQLPPKPRPIIVEQWLPAKPPTKRIVYHRLNEEKASSASTLIVHHSKPRALIELELIALPVVKVDRQYYEQLISKHVDE